MKSTTLYLFLAFLGWALASCRKNNAHFNNPSYVSAIRKIPKKEDTRLTNEPFSHPEIFSFKDSVSSQKEVIDPGEIYEVLPDKKVTLEVPPISEQVYEIPIPNTSLSPKKMKKKGDPTKKKGMNTFLTTVLLVLALVYPFLIVGLPLLILRVHDLKRSKEYPPEHFQKVGLRWGKISLITSLLALLFIAASFLGGFVAGLWPLFICSLAVSSGLVGLIYRPKKNKPAAWGAILGGIPILTGIIFVLLLLFSGFGP